MPSPLLRRASRLAAATTIALLPGLALTGTAAAEEYPDDPDLAEQNEVRNGPPGDNGTVKVHDPDTPDDDNRNEPHVCEFTLVGSQFDAEQEIWWKIRAWPPTDDTGQRPVVLHGTLTLDEDGHGSTETHTLDDGHYKLFWNFEGQQGNAKQKVFWVDCDEESDEDDDTDNGDNGDDGDTDNGSKDKDKDKDRDKDDEGTDGEQDDGEKDTDDGHDKEAPAEEQDADGGLPVTGASLAGLVAAAALTLGGGGAALMLSRKRRTAAAPQPPEEA